VIDTAPAPKHGQVIDIIGSLKRSMERVPAKKRPATTAAAAKKKRECRKKVEQSASAGRPLFIK
jgi:hypothetical protein